MGLFRYVLCNNVESVVNIVLLWCGVYVCSWTCVWRLWRGRWMRRRRRSTAWNTTRRNCRETWRSSRKPTSSSRVSSKHCAARWGNLTEINADLGSLPLMEWHLSVCAVEINLYSCLSKYTWHNGYVHTVGLWSLNLEMSRSHSKSTAASWIRSV